jgi:hypothetical protein
MGMGQAVAASASGTEALWWNPALIARSQREAAFGTVSGSLLQSDMSLALVYPIPRVLSLGLSFRYLNEGEQESTQSDVQTGTFVPSTAIIAATFGAPFGDRFAAGISIKMLAISYSATGQVLQAPDSPPRTGALDLGAQFIATKDSAFVIGASIRNLGLSLQINDAPQADPLPSRLDVGVQYRRRVPQYPILDLKVAGDVVTRLSGVGGPGFRLGGEASWESRYFARAGFIVSGPGDASGPTVGVGAAYQRWQIDFAQFLSNTAAGIGERPTYLSIRYRF